MIQSRSQNLGNRGLVKVLVTCCPLWTAVNGPDSMPIYWVEADHRGGAQTVRIKVVVWVAVGGSVSVRKIGGGGGRVFVAVEGGL